MPNRNRALALTGAGAAITVAQMGELAKAFAPLARDAKALLRRAPAGAPAPQQRNKKASKPKMSRMEAPVNHGYTSNNLVKFSQKMATSKSTIYRGCSVLGSIRTSAAATTTLPQCTFYAASNPVTFPDRLQIMATTFDKYVYKSVTLKFQPQVPSSTAGLVALCIDRDYMDPPQSLNWAQVLSYESAVSGSVWMEHVTSIKRETSERKSYYTNFTADTNFRDSEQFKFYVFTLGCPASTILGQLYIEYEIELISPVYAPDEISGNLAAFQMTNIIPSNVTCAAASTTFTIAGLPAYTATAGSLVEIIISGNYAGSTIQVGSTGVVWNPSIQNSYRFFARPTLGTGYALYLDYPSAINNEPAANALFNPGAIAFNLFGSASATFRLLAGTSPTAE